MEHDDKTEKLMALGRAMEDIAGTMDDPKFPDRAIKAMTALGVIRELTRICPWCGTKETTHTISASGDRMECEGCGAGGPRQNSKQAAVSAWNGPTCRDRFDA